MKFGCTEDRLHGFAERYRTAGRPIPEELVFEGDFSFERGEAAVTHLLSSGIDFDAVFAHNDLSAAGA